MRLLGTTLLALIVCAAGGCSAPREQGSLPLTMNCITIRTIERWRVLDASHVIVYTPERTAAYLVELSGECLALTEAPEHIGTTVQEDGHLCAGDRDALLVRGQRCGVSTILPYKINP